MQDHSEKQRSFFARRLVAIWADSLIIYFAVYLAVKLSGVFNVYLPFELTFLALASPYVVAFIHVKGYTPGKALCGLVVTQKNGHPPGVWRTLFRETIGKLLSIAIVPLTGGLVYVLLELIPFKNFISFGKVIPFFSAIAASLIVLIIFRRRPLHDCLSGTTVDINQKAGWARYGTALSAISLLIVIVLLGRTWYQVYTVTQQMAFRPDYTLPSHSRDTNTLKDVRELGDEEEIQLAHWLDENAVSPIDYAVEKCRQYPLVIFGEQHEQRETLRLFNELIPILYERAGVTTIAMELFMAEENEAIDQLVTAPTFDREAVMKLARRMDFWGIWGFQGYWDVFETVWALNQTIPDGQPTVRLIGLGMPVDVQSFAMLGFENNAASDVPIWEKLRIVRFLKIFPVILSRDAFMASELEKEIIERKERGIALIGSAHTPVRSPRPGFADGPRGRMGFMLWIKYPESVFQLVLHHSQSRLDESVAEPVFHDFLERVMARRGDQPVGFEVEGSPFAVLRDSAGFAYRDKRLGFADFTPGYIYLNRLDSIRQCLWVEDYVSQKMFVANKPFYRSYGKYFDYQVNNVQDVNNMFLERHQ